MYVYSNNNNSMLNHQPLKRYVIVVLLALQIVNKLATTNTTNRYMPRGINILYLSHAPVAPPTRCAAAARGVVFLLEQIRQMRASNGSLIPLQRYDNATSADDREGCSVVRCHIIIL